MAAQLTGLSRLPPEVVEHIVLLSAQPTNQEDDVLAARRRRRQLESLSLVCSAWRPIAQKALLEEAEVDLFHAREFRPLARLLARREQGLGKLLRRMSIELWGEEQPDELVQTVRACEGLEELALVHLERLRMDEVAAGPNLASLSLRQCTLVSFFYPLLDPPADRLPPLLAYSSLTRLDLRLCSLRRDFLPFSFDSTYLPLPSLQHLLLHTGSHDQSPSTIRSLVRSVAAQLRSLSLDHSAEEILYPLHTDTAPLDFPSLRCYGLYWDAAYHSLAGSSLFTRSTTRSPPPFLHLALYPAALDSLLATLETLFSNREFRWAWRGVEHLRVEGTLRDVDAVEMQEPDSDEELEIGEATIGGRIDSLLKLAKEAGADVLVEERGEDSGTAERATFRRGFGTSCWQYVREVEEERVQYGSSVGATG
ncbi:hypothetical protein JCM10296v2_007407 [Rhodotorula toruloides]